MLASPLTTSVFCLAYSSTAPFFNFRKWTLDEKTSLPAIDYQMDISTSHRGPPDSKPSYSGSSATYRTICSGPLSFPNITFPTIFSPPIGVKGVPPIHSLVSDPLALFRDPSKSPTRTLASYCLDVQVQETILNPFSIVVEYCSNHLLKLGRRYLYRKLDVFMALKSKMWGFGLH